jgi:hypothetical protein
LIEIGVGMKSQEELPPHIAGDLYGPVDGWFLYYRPARFAALLRFRERPDGRLVVLELYLRSEEGVASGVLRGIPVGRAEATANTPGAKEKIIDLLRSESIAERVAPRVPTWTFQLPTELGAPSARIRPRLKIRIPPGPRKRGDEFYRRVAEAYSWLATRSNRPAAEFAELNDVPITMVHRWVKEARRRGLLGPGRRGGAG